MSNFRRKILANQIQSIPPVPIEESKIIMKFNRTVGEWFIEDNINGYNEYYQIDNGSKISFDYRPTRIDHYIKFNNGKLGDKTLTLYNNPPEYSYKGIKRRSAGLVSIDFSSLRGPFYWYFWDNQNYSNLQNIIFPTTFNYVAISMVGKFNNITIQPTQQVIFTSITSTNNVIFTNDPYDLRLWCDNSSSSEITNIYNKIQSINVRRGILNLGPSASITEQQRQQFIDKNFVVNIISTNNWYDANWDFN